MVMSSSSRKEGRKDWRDVAARVELKWVMMRVEGSYADVNRRITPE